MPLTHLEYWPAQGVIEISIDERGYILMGCKPPTPPPGVVEPPRDCTDSSPVPGGCDDWVVPPLGPCLDATYDSIHRFFTPRTTLRNFIDAFFTHKSRVRIYQVSLDGRFV